MNTRTPILFAAALGLAACTDMFVQTSARDLPVQSKTLVVHIVEAEDWRMFLMDASDVDREILRLHQFHRVHYQVAGSLVESFR